jgi:hypothetical protein
MLLNRKRAFEVMDRHGLDAIVATTPENAYYLRGATPLATLAQEPFRDVVTPGSAEQDTPAPTVHVA